MSQFYVQLLISVIVGIAVNINAIPLASNAVDTNQNSTIEHINDKNSTSVTAAPADKASNGEPIDTDQITAYVLPSNVDPSLYSDYLTPEAIQQYVQQFGNTLPALIYTGYASPQSSSTPITQSTEAPTTGETVINSITTKANSLRNRKTSAFTTVSKVINAVLDFMPWLLDFSLFRVVITIASMALSILMGNSIIAAFCNLTMLCSAESLTVDYISPDINMKHLEDPELKAERVRRALNVVTNAIFQYKSPKPKTKSYQRFKG